MNFEQNGSEFGASGLGLVSCGIASITAMMTMTVMIDDDDCDTDNETNMGEVKFHFM